MRGGAVRPGVQAEQRGDTKELNMTGFEEEPHEVSENIFSILTALIVGVASKCVPSAHKS